MTTKETAIGTMSRTQLLNDMEAVETRLADCPIDITIKPRPNRIPRVFEDETLRDVIGYWAEQLQRQTVAEQKGTDTSIDYAMAELNDVRRARGLPLFHTVVDALLDMYTQMQDTTKYENVAGIIQAWHERGAPAWSTLPDGRITALVASALTVHEQRQNKILSAIGEFLNNMADNVREAPFEDDPDSDLQELNTFEDATLHSNLKGDGKPTLVLRFKPAPDQYTWKLRYKVTIEPVTEAGWMDTSE
jgi:hypothetical protein